MINKKIKKEQINEKLKTEKQRKSPTNKEYIIKINENFEVYENNIEVSRDRTTYILNLFEIDIKYYFEDLDRK
jgi:hypothetical protein